MSRRRNRSKSRKQRSEKGSAAAPLPGDPRLRVRISRLLPTRRGLAACRSLDVDTIGDFLKTAPQAFLDVPNCGAGTLADLTVKVHRYLMETPAPTAPPAGPAAAATANDDPEPTALEDEAAAPDPASTWDSDKLDLPLAEVVSSPRAALVFEQLGIMTLRDFLDTPRSQLLSVSKFAERTYRAVVERVRLLATHVSLDPSLLPQRLLMLQITELGLGTELVTQVKAAGHCCVGDLLAAGDLLGDAGPQGHAAIHDALDRIIREGVGGRAAAARPATSFGELLARMTDVVDNDGAGLFRDRVGLRGSPTPLRELAAQRRRSTLEVRRQLAAVRRTFEQKVPDLLEQLRGEAEREMDAAEGWVTGKRLAPGTLLHGAAKAGGDAAVPLRLLSFLFPGEYFPLGKGLTRTSPAAVRSLRIALRRLTRPALLPVSLADLQQQVLDRLPGVERGLLLHLVNSRSDLSLYIDPVRGEIIERQPDEVAERAEKILAEQGEAMLVEDLQLACKDATECSSAEVLSALRTDQRFVEVGLDTWDLRERHTEQLAELAEETQRIAAKICEAGGRHSVRSLVKQESGDRAVFLIASMLRGNAKLRDLGRGDFCPADQEMSAVLQDLCADLRRAMGEVPMSRFLENQTPDQRRLIEQLLRQNRLFVSPAPDRVDLLENYPFNERRLRELVDLIDDTLRAGHGYASLERLAAVVRKTHLGGEFLTPHLLGDVLRRHGPFELLPGGIVAQADLELLGWIQQRAREALRAAALPLSPTEIVLEVPELAEFEQGLAAILETDPMVTRAGETQFVVV